MSGSLDADFTMLDCPPAAPGDEPAQDDCGGVGHAPAMDADVSPRYSCAKNVDRLVVLQALQLTCFPPAGIVPFLV